MPHLEHDEAWVVADVDVLPPPDARGGGGAVHGVGGGAGGRGGGLAESLDSQK